LSECKQTGLFQEIAKAGSGTGSDCQIDYDDEATWKIQNGNLSIDYGNVNIDAVTYFKVKNNVLKVGQYDDECSGGWSYTELIRVD